MKIKSASVWPTASIVIAGGLLLLGIYLVALTLAPTYKSIMTDPENNSTTAKLSQTKQAIRAVYKLGLA